ncbi:unnamed protein product [Parascedosporium putredinis]|uniref:Phospholipid/glycerol acyltransferase domain-containing protein n=1 Tax=Parascedosporium putredinis TaxID=1442378 RepID=A0A9P1H6X4_9PEZI|nr:unnamed protein product [Parascedosporium putredinis]CAI8000858.1 unnamed protein product [Parascedosporium putredinis]
MWDRLISWTVNFWLGSTALVVFFLLPLPVGCVELWRRRVLSFRLLGLAGSAQWAVGRMLKFLMYWTTGVVFVTVDPHGILNSVRPAVLVGNHQTELDVLMLGIFIDRGNAKDARQALKGAGEEIARRNQSVYVFPEGTRSYSDEPILMPFKKGAFHLAIEAGAPIVPCVVANYSHVFNIKARVFNSGTIPVKVLAPIPTKGLTSADVDKLMSETREKMLQELITLTAEARGTVPASK